MPLFTNTTPSNTFSTFIDNTNTIVDAMNTLLSKKAGLGMDESGNEFYPDIQAYNLDIYNDLNVANETKFTGVVQISDAFIVDHLYFSDTTSNKDPAENPKIYATSKTDIQIAAGTNTVTVNKIANSVEIDSDFLDLKGSTRIKSDDLNIIVDTETINIDKLDSADNDYISPLNDDLSGKLALSLPSDGVLKFGDVAIRVKSDNTLEYNANINDATKTWDALGGGGSGSSAVEYKNVTLGTPVPEAEGGPVDIDYLLSASVGTPVSIVFDSANNQMKYVGASANTLSPAPKVGILTEKTAIGGGSTNFDLGVTFLGNFTFDTTLTNTLLETGEPSFALGTDYFVSETTAGRLTSQQPTSISDFAFRIVGLNSGIATGLVMPYRPAASGDGNKLIVETFVGNGTTTQFPLAYRVPSLSNDYLMAFIAGVLDTDITVKFGSIVYNSTSYSNIYYVEFATAPPNNFEVVIRYFKDVPIAIFDSKVNRDEYGLTSNIGEEVIAAAGDVGKYELWVKEDALIAADVYFNGMNTNIITVSSSISDQKENSGTINIYVDNNGALKVQNKTTTTYTLVVYQKL